jgi:hypothetical protein
MSTIFNVRKARSGPNGYGYFPGSLVSFKVLLPTPLGEEAMNAVKKLAEKSELKITLDKQ